MTVNRLKDKRNESILRRSGVAIFFALAIILIINANAAKDAVIFGIRLSVLSIIPAIFPFFILSDLLSASYTEKSGIFSRLFGKIFNISPSAFPAFIIGLLCGFPLGVRTSAELYKNGDISKEECEALSGFVNNPSLAFAISGVGLGMLGSIRLGFLLYFSVIAASVLVGILFKPKSQKTQKPRNNTRQSFNLGASIKNAGLSSLGVSSYIIFFSTVLGVLSKIIQDDRITALLSPIFEVGNAAKLISSSNFFTGNFAFSLIAFALGFSGLSVFMQASSYLPAEISRRKIFLMKLCEGIFAGVIAAIFFSVFEN